MTTMMPEQFSRTAMLVGRDGVEKLQNSRVAVFGLGGVGSYVTEALARSGIGALDLIDHDRVALSNINRQLIATHETVGMLKVDAACARIKSINPECRVTLHPVFFTQDCEEPDFARFDYVVDAIDTVSGKLAIIVRAKAASVPVISCMGTGNKLHPTSFEVADIYATTVCPLARTVRTECRKRGISGFKVVYSKEQPAVLFHSQDDEKPEPGRRSVPGSVAFVPSAAGLVIAGEVILDLLGRLD